MSVFKSQIVKAGVAGLVFLSSLLSVSSASADLTITFGGDVNFNKNRQKPLADGANVFGRKIPFEQTTRGLRGLVDGDVNFANIETVVTDAHDLSALEKQFVFRSHPKAIQHLIDIGFNLFSLANNHSYNHGFAGLEQTLAAFEGFKNSGSRIAFAGIESSRDAFKTARILEVNGHRIAIAAISITDPSFRATKSKTGVLNYRDDNDYELVLKSLKDAQADLRILSIHAGVEMKVTLDGAQQARFEQALHDGDVDLILGSHPHVVRPVSRVGDKLIFYSLGNYLMLGSADISRLETAKNYGLFGRVHYAYDASKKRLVAQAVEAIPLTQVHLAPRVLSATESKLRIENLNQLSRSELGKDAVSFGLRGDGTGVACDSRGLAMSSRARAVCP